MDRETVVRLVQQCNMTTLIECKPGWLERIEQFADMVSTAVKEEDARICEGAQCFNYDEPGDSYAAAILASIKTKAGE